MKLAILIIYFGYGVTSQVVPADKCEALARQWTNTGYANHRAECLYYEGKKP